MPINNINVGRDCTITVFDPTTNVVVTLAIITSFDAKQDVTKLKSKGLDGTVRVAVEPETWSGKIMLDRANPNCDKLFNILEAAYFAGTNIQAVTITQTIAEADTTITQWRFSGAALCLEDSGNWANGKFIAQSISWEASRRIQVV